MRIEHPHKLQEERSRHRLRQQVRDHRGARRVLQDDHAPSDKICPFVAQEEPQEPEKRFFFKTCSPREGFKPHFKSIMIFWSVLGGFTHAFTEIIQLICIT